MKFLASLAFVFGAISIGCVIIFARAYVLLKGIDWFIIPIFPEVVLNVQYLQVVGFLFMINLFKTHKKPEENNKSKEENLEIVLKSILTEVSIIAFALLTLWILHLFM